MTREDQLIQHFESNRLQLSHMLGEELVKDIIKMAKELRLVKRAIIDPTVTDVEAL